jgi:hypothetical protein
VSHRHGAGKLVMCVLSVLSVQLHRVLGLAWHQWVIGDSVTREV